MCIPQLEKFYVPSFLPSWPFTGLLGAGLGDYSVLANFLYTISFKPHNSRPEALLLPTMKLGELGFRKADMFSPKSEAIPGFI